MGGLSLLPESQWKKWLILAGPVLSHVLHVLLHVAGVFLGNYCCDPERGKGMITGASPGLLYWIHNLGEIRRDKWTEHDNK